MKASMHLGNGKASHNDRRFDLDKADHIDQERTAQNFACNYSDDKAEQHMPFEDFERQYYERRYAESLTLTNEKYLAQRHPEKVRSMDDWLKTYKPTEVIIQLGNAEDQINDKYLVKAFTETMRELKEKYPQMKPLNIAIHRDETTPHIHLRFVIEGHDKSGHLKPLKTQGLKEMGIERPDLSKPEGRYNNPLMTFTNEMRETLYRKIEELGLDLDRTPHLNQQHKETLQYKKDMLAEDIHDLEIERTGAEQSFKAEQKHYEEELTGLQENYDQQKAVLQAQYDAERTRLDAEYAEKKKIIAEREAKLTQQEKGFPGRELKLRELEDIQAKMIWSSEDKQNIIKTAMQSAENAKKARSLKAENKDLQKQVETMEPFYQDYDRVQSQVKYRDETVIPKLEKQVAALKKDIEVRDEFIRDHGMMPDFVEEVRSMGIRLAEKVAEMKENISRSFDRIR